MSTTVYVPPAWRDTLARFDAELRAAGRPRSTRDMRSYQLRRFAADHPTTPPPEITREHLISWLGSRDWAPETRRAYRAALTTLFRWLHATGQVDIDPASSLPTVTVPRALPRPAPDAALLAGLTEADDRTRLAIEAIDATGLRRAEAAALHSTQLMTAVDGSALRVVGKGGHVRVVPVPERVAFRIRKTDGFVFPGQIDGHLSPHYLGKLISHALPGRWTAHTLRHRYATRVYAATNDLRAVQELLGHANIQTTARYVGVTGDRLRDAARAAWDLPRAA
ncbi:tyrosine-type recombinase/integrase [Dietzia alimentaria]|uniref:tyrosine-type recombinase/integrase n=1 Tax=Dietzia alimentaria TaxID=665550 RepID=UPI0002F6C666|nr:tyrosine-type recombinase/integrase [Dietzia alimentaria]